MSVEAGCHLIGARAQLLWLWLPESLGLGDEDVAALVLPLHARVPAFQPGVDVVA